mmetsp:Transcript_27670/g.39577  ORF Transcript_27670/g.39577 Transcript_27670/m.39577 type:complete len:436 (+) Transcript_27670:214-1521(+)
MTSRNAQQAVDDQRSSACSSNKALFSIASSSFPSLSIFRKASFRQLSSPSSWLSDKVPPVSGTKRLASDALEDCNRPQKKASGLCWWRKYTIPANLPGIRNKVPSSSIKKSTEDDVATLEDEPQQHDAHDEIKKTEHPPFLTSSATKVIQLMHLPDDLVGHCIAFLDPAEDRASVTLTCRKLRQMINADRILRLTNLFGCPSAKNRCIILESDSKESAMKRLQPFLNAGSTDAMYLAGMIKCYCDEDVDAGVALLIEAAEYEHLEAMYSLGIILRDLDRNGSRKFLEQAHLMGYLPATLEILSASEVRKVHGDLTAQQLQLHLGPIALGKLLRKYFVDWSKTRLVSSSHCWNPACGRWGYKNAQTVAITVNNTNTVEAHETTAGSERYTCPSGFQMVCARMKVCSSCRRAKYCSKLCQVYDWRSDRHKVECQFIR